MKDEQQQMQVDGNDYKFHKVINIDETDPEFLIFHKLVHMVVGGCTMGRSGTGDGTSHIAIVEKMGVQRFTRNPKCSTNQKYYES